MTKDTAALATLEALGPEEALRTPKLADRRKTKPRGPDMRLRKRDDGTLIVEFRHEDPDTAALLLMADMGTTKYPFFLGLSGQMDTSGKPAFTGGDQPAVKIWTS